jgi:hypothetical protein
MVNISQYQIELERSNGVYLAGEHVRGTLHLRTSADIECRGVRLRLTGKGYVHWHTGGGDNRTDYYGKKEYVSRSMTVLGNFHKTLCLSEAGTNAYFDKDNGGGEIIIPLEEEKVSDDFVLAVRSMDYDWGKKDDLLGETLVRVAQDLLVTPGKEVSFPLRRKGRAVAGKGGNRSEVTLSGLVEELEIDAAWDDFKYILRLTCHQTTGLRSADFFGKNDVYVQCYEVPKNTDENGPLPKPTKSFTIRAQTQYSIPFSFKLPDKYLPSSFSTWHGDACYVNYSLYSNIDIALWRDPSIRRYITVISVEMPSPTLLAPMIKPKTHPQTIYGCECCSFTCCEKGEAFFRAAIDKRYLSPGDTIFITAFADNGTEDDCDFTVSLRQEATMQSSVGRSTRITIEHLLLEDKVPAGGTMEWSTANPKMATVPAVPPTFHKDRATSSQGIVTRDPLSWWYLLSVTMAMPGYYSTNIVWNAPVTVGALSVHSLREIDLKKYGAHGAHLEAEQVAGIGNDDLPPAIEDVEYPPPDYKAEDLVKNTVQVDSTNLKYAEDEVMENKYDVGGHPTPYAPSYPAPEVKSSKDETNLPDCRP